MCHLFSGASQRTDGGGSSHTFQVNRVVCGSTYTLVEVVVSEFLPVDELSILQGLLDDEDGDSALAGRSSTHHDFHDDGAVGSDGDVQIVRFDGSGVTSDAIRLSLKPRQHRGQHPPHYPSLTSQSVTSHPAQQQPTSVSSSSQGSQPLPLQVLQLAHGVDAAVTASDHRHGSAFDAEARVRGSIDGGSSSGVGMGRRTTSQVCFVC